MKYRHAYHAGNFADVHKHVVLLELIHALQRKDKGFLYIDTHAGRGLYDLAADAAQASGEARHGLGLLRKAAPAHGALRAFLEAQRGATGGEPHRYAGSPLLAAAALRAQDRAVCCELQPPECRALERALAAHRGVRCECADGQAMLAALLPPPERRALVLIDPAYELQQQDLATALAAAGTALARLASAVIALWYPIKDEREPPAQLRQAVARWRVPALVSELWVHPRDARVGLNGSGILLLNPPYQCDEAMREWLPELAAALGASEGAAPSGGQQVLWLTDEH